ncbi:hypothetical protein BDF14DRAFT_1420761 [Spinellus fusiger]|nr:hypothetical protein BDF14DRAFT_1420761 [Spinellus fusiger]
MITTHTSFFSGCGMLGCLFLLVFGAHPLIRTLAYRVFRLTHLVAFGGLCVLGMMHHRHFVVFYAVVVVGWMVERGYRIRMGCLPVHVVSVETLTEHLVKLRVEPPYKVSTLLPGQFVYLSFSKSRMARWVFSHPFSISKIEKRDDQEKNTVAIFTFYIKTTGQQTRIFHQLAQRERKESALSMRLSISPPLGLPILTLAGEGYGDFGVVVLIAEGIGITPWISVLQSMQQQSVSTKTLTLVWTVAHLGKCVYSYTKK